MTGFARTQGDLDTQPWTWEIKSVNGRGLELRLRLPSGFEHLEIVCRKILGEHLSRGNVHASLSVGSVKSQPSFIVNEANLEAALHAINSIQSKIPCEQPRPENILALKGVLQTDVAEQDVETQKRNDQTLLDGFVAGLKALKRSREAEGAVLAHALGGHLSEIKSLQSRAMETAKHVGPLFQKRLQKQINEMLSSGEVEQGRIAQEAALLAVKADVREELDRLDAHIKAADRLLMSDKPIGRRFDFLVQEFNREANTLCAKAPDLSLKEIGLSLKTVIDQMREQVQNIE
ncbi:MAG: YicC/YloC family endoribonuclease [Pseudomonadota bacterium]